MPKKCYFSIFACILVVLSLMFGNGNYNTESVAYAEEGVTRTYVPTPSEQPSTKPSPTGPFPVEGQPPFLTGWFNIVWGDGPEGAKQTIYMLTDDSGQITPLLLDETLSRSVGGVLWFDRKKVNVAGVWATSLSVQGAATGLLSVTSISLAPSPETGALSGDVSPAVIGSQPWVTIMCKFSDVVTEPHNLAYFTGMYANVRPGLDHFWRELSYDTFNVAGSNAFGWFTLPHPEIYYNPTDTGQGTNLSLLANDCIAAADASVNFAPYSGINMMFNTDFDNGWAWGGSRYMTLDGATKSWRITWEPPWAYADISVIQHEMGHGFGLPHSSGAYGATYDNAWDVMSWDRFNCAAATDPTYGCIAQGTISYHKDILGVIPAGQKFTVTLGSSTTITLEQLALPATSNYKMAQIPIGGSSTHFYTVEARRLTGYDSKLAGAAVILHEVDTTRGIPAHVIDTDLNGVTSDAGAMWVVGETFTDATNNISVHVDLATATGFQVTISNASLPTLSDLIETAVSNPPVSATAGSSFSVTDTVENRGNASAGASITSYYFSMDTTKGSGDVLLTGSRSVPSLGINGTNSGTITVTIPSGTASGSYYLLACADDTNAVAESNEENNCIASANKVNVSVVPGILSVTPSDGLASSGNQGGPFSPSSKNYTLQNTGGASLSWTASKTQTWTTLSSTSGTLAANATTTVTVSINSNANSLTPASYGDTVSFINTTNGNGNTTRPVSLTVSTAPTGLTVTPTDGLISSGISGGPFSPPSKVYTLQNTGGSSINWTASVTQTWVSLSSTSGTLAAGASTTVTVSINNNANSLPANANPYSDTVTFATTTNGNGNTTRAVSLTITGPPSGSITVTSPNGGENWAAGTTQTINWTYTGNPGSYVKIELLKGGKLNLTIYNSRSIGTAGSGSYSWPIRSTLAGGSDYQVRVTSTTNSAYTDTSNANFTITGPPPPSITVTSPNGGENWAAGTTQTIQWTYSGNPGSYVKIELLKGGVLNRTIVSSVSKGTAGSGFYSWPIPSTQAGGSDYQVKVTSTTNSAYTDASDGNFTITGPPPPSITVTSPNGGETWAAGTTQTISWSYTGSPGSYVKIELFKSGVLALVISSSCSIGSGGSGSYAWITPTSQAGGSDYQVRVTSTTNSAYTDLSDSNFTIAGPPPPTISVVSPNGGESWPVGTKQTILWSYSGNVGSSVKIELLKAGVVYRTITSSALVGRGGSGSYSFSIPYNQAVGSDYRVRVTSDSGYTDTSDSDFTIK